MPTAARQTSWPEAFKPLASVGKISTIVLFAIVAGTRLTLTTQVVGVRPQWCHPRADDQPHLRTAHLRMPKERPGPRTWGVLGVIA